MHTPTRRGKPGRSQVLYWYRTPPGVRVGRKPFSEDVQRMLEAQHPGVTFDWPAIINTPMPPPDMTEFWREKRRAAKAAKEERRAQEAAEVEEETGEQTPRRAAEADAVDEPASDDDAGGAELSADGTDGEESVEAAATGEAEGGDEAAGRKRRRRRGGRRRRSAAARQSTDGTTGDAGSAPPEGEATVGESASVDEPAPPQTEPTE